MLKFLNKKAKNDFENFYNTIYQKGCNKLNIQNISTAYFQKPYAVNQNNKKIYNVANNKNDVFFGANFEVTKQKNNQFLIHSSNFLREESSDELLRNYILSNWNDRDINIAVGACSSGEEVYTLSILLDSIKDRVKITGFDVDKNSINSAKNGAYAIQTNNSRSNVKIFDGDDSFLVEDKDDLTSLQQEFKAAFHEKFNVLDDDFIVNKNKLTAGQKFANFINRRIGFNENDRFPTYNKYKRFKVKDNAFKNCEFKQGNILNIDEYFGKESVDILFFRNALYHLVCEGDQFSRKMNEEAEDIIRSIAKKANEIIKPDGFFVFGQSEYLQGIDTKLVYKIMEEEGFRPFNIENSKTESVPPNLDENLLKTLNTNIWQKNNC